VLSGVCHGTNDPRPRLQRHFTRQAMDIKEEDILGPHITNHWYYASKGRAMRRYLDGVPRRSLLDVGAGSGVFSKILLEHGSNEAVCVDPAYVDNHASEHQGKPIQFVRSVDSSSADLVLMMDVCEHVDDDVELLSTYAKMVKPGTHFLITVPAFQFLFSGHDQFLEHKRRYTINSLEKSVMAAGLQVLCDSYYFATVFPLAAIHRLIERPLVGAGTLPAKSSLKIHSPIVNLTLKCACAAELPLFRFNRLFGLTVFCLAEKT
jgi:2-polyprenyl-3-methyl-5-hydroxy-6-metoxy-1,4-benzoquinol methylase